MCVLVLLSLGFVFLDDSLLVSHLFLLHDRHKTLYFGLLGVHVTKYPLALSHLLPRASAPLRFLIALVIPVCCVCKLLFWPHQAKAIQKVDNKVQKPKGERSVGFGLGLVRAGCAGRG